MTLQKVGLRAVAIVALAGQTPLGAQAGGGGTAPDFTLHDTCGQPVSLKGYRGAVVWLTFGATW